ncbi:hypothetical protein GCM10011506_25250 [Marivirga lumbricoides]|uniref:ABC transporter permease n=2 Tax=Marivirga lumbricoides TaxID=1046115 RepID=A0ABQ1MD18_9BACT|nr:hypothetical protein GCM10011506_25250 [Marivirga lumbricoides]
MENLEGLMVVIILNDPTVIGYFFVALAIYTEMKYDILAAIFVSPLKVHHYLLAKIIALSLIGTVCALILAFSILGFSFNIFAFTIGCMAICIISASLAIFMLSYTDEFLKFAMRSVPVFLALVALPLIDYFQLIDMGWLAYILPIQSSIDLIDYGIRGTAFEWWYVLPATVLFVGGSYQLAYYRFTKAISLKS